MRLRSSSPGLAMALTEPFGPRPGLASRWSSSQLCTSLTGESDVRRRGLRRGLLSVRSVRRGPRRAVPNTPSRRLYALPPWLPTRRTNARGFDPGRSSLRWLVTPECGVPLPAAAGSHGRGRSWSRPRRRAATGREGARRLCRLPRGSFHAHGLSVHSTDASACRLPWNDHYAAET